MILFREQTVEPAPNLPRSASSQDGTLLSPSIQRVAGEQMAAFELKFLIRDSVAADVQDWANSAMQRDAYADPALGDAYQTTTLYLDTPQRDVFRRAPGHRRSKFRLRRYGCESRVFLERKSRHGDRVAKRRCDVQLDELPAVLSPEPTGAWPGEWFRERVAQFAFQPACLLTYDRTAFFKITDDGPLRMTLDRRIRGQANDSWDLTPLHNGQSILDDHVVCEFKFRGSMPGLFKDVIQTLKLEAGSVSKYRRMMLATGLICEEGRGYA